MFILYIFSIFILHCILQFLTTLIRLIYLLHTHKANKKLLKVPESATSPNLETQVITQIEYTKSTLEATALNQDE